MHSGCSDTRVEHGAAAAAAEVAVSAAFCSFLAAARSRLPYGLRICLLHLMHRWWGRVVAAAVLLLNP